MELVMASGRTTCQIALLNTSAIAPVETPRLTSPLNGPRVTTADCYASFARQAESSANRSCAHNRSAHAKESCAAPSAPLGPNSTIYIILAATEGKAKRLEVFATM